MTGLDLNMIRAWRPETVIAAADQLAQKSSAFLAILDDVKERTNRAAGSSFGAGEEARYAHVDKTVSTGYAQHELLTQHQQLASECGYALKAKRDALLEEVLAAQKAGLIVRADAVVEGDYPRQAELIDKYAESVGRAKHDLEQTDADYARKIRDLNAKIKDSAGGYREAKYFDTFGGGVKDDPVDPEKAAKDRAQRIADGAEPLPTDPKDLNELFQHVHADKDSDLLKALQRRYPDIGNKPGFPFEDRDICNRQRLDDLKRQQQDSVNAWRQQHPDWPTDRWDKNPGSPEGRRWREWKNQLDGLQHQLDGYNDTQAALDKSRPKALGGDGLTRYLGYIDDKGHASVSIGNPDLAKKVSTFVPGTGCDMAKMTGSDEYSARLYDMAHRMDPSLGKNDVSVTTWMGYDRPMNIFNPADSQWAGNPTFAKEGAQALDDWQSGLRYSHEDANPDVGGRAYQTVIGHSYGSAEVGASAANGHHLDADAMVGVGTPGMIGNSAHDMNINQNGRVFIATAQNDMIRVATGLAAPVSELGFGPLGNDPTTWTDATQFKTDPGDPGPWYQDGLSGDAHGSYFKPDSTGLKNMGRIIDGQEPEHK